MALDYLTDPIIIDHNSVSKATKTDLLILQELRNRAKLINPEVKAGIKDFLSLNHIAHLENIQHLEGNINNSIHKIIQHKAAYPYAYFWEDEYGLHCEIVLIQPKGVEDHYDVLPYRKACFAYSVPALDAEIDNLIAKKPQEDISGKTEIILYGFTESQKINFNPHRLCLEHHFEKIFYKGFRLKNGLQFAPLQIPHLLKDIQYYLSQDKTLTEVLPDYHILPNQIELDSQGELGQLPELLQHMYSQAYALEKYIIPLLADIAQQKDWLQFQEKIFQFQELQTRLPFTIEKAVERVQALMDLIEMVSFSELRDKPVNLDQIQYSIELLRAMVTLLPDMQRQIEFTYQDSVLHFLTQKIHSESTRMDNQADNIKGARVSEINLEMEISQIQMEPERRQEIMDTILRKLKERFACLPAQKGAQEKNKYYFADHRYMLAIQANLAAQAKNNSLAKQLLVAAQSMEHRLRQRGDTEINSKLVPEQIAFLEKDLAKQTQEKTQSKDNSLMIFLFSSLAFILYMVLIYFQPQFWPIILFVFPIAFILYYNQRNKDKPKTNLDKIDQILSNTSSQKQTTETKGTPERERKSQMQKPLHSTQDKQPVKSAPEKETEKNQPPKTKSLNEESILGTIDHLWEQMLSKKNPANIFPPNLEQISNAMSVEPERIKKNINAQRNFYRNELFIFPDNANKVQYLSTKRFLQKNKKEIQEFYKHIYDTELNQPQFTDEKRLAFAQHMLSVLAKKT